MDLRGVNETKNLKQDLSCLATRGLRGGAENREQIRGCACEVSSEVTMSSRRVSSLICILIFCFFCLQFSIVVDAATDSISQGQNITHSERIVSAVRGLRIRNVFKMDQQGAEGSSEGPSCFLQCWLPSAPRFFTLTSTVMVASGLTFSKSSGALPCQFPRSKPIPLVPEIAHVYNTDRI
ncbi:hypothetical protein Ddye_027232 [Dipteronia dyeriana]|uniref:Uncharacterized protein n=1 Tax=Dipteronia dyeriana TaxID=168575 RepID=A0AAD9WR69_9ROSI|nr:hypothetical protein Ddye_027232 [Dipteronia dyeriana]